MITIPNTVLRHCWVPAEPVYHPDTMEIYLRCPKCGLRTKAYSPSMEVPSTDWDILAALVTEWNELVSEQKIED